MARRLLVLVTAAAAALALALTAAGCGSDEPESPAPAAAPGDGEDAAAAKRKRRRPGCNRFCRQAGGFGAPPDQENPVLIRSQTARVGGDSLVGIRARCRLDRTCDGAIILAGRVEYGRANLRMAANATRTVYVAVTRAGRRELRREGRDRTGFATVPLKSDHPVSISKRITLLPPR